jgi:hypothetical protein
MNPVGFEPKISAGEGQLTYTLDRAATESGLLLIRDAHLLIYVLFKVALHNSEYEHRMTEERIDNEL